MKEKTKQEILYWLFKNAKWNSNFSQEEAFIRLYYKNFKSLKLVGEHLYFRLKEMGKEKYETYYSKEIIDYLILLEEKNLTEEEFETFMLRNTLVNKNNFYHLKNNNLLELLEHFYSNFRGNIEEIYKFDKHVVIRTYFRKEDESHYYNMKNISMCYESLEIALISSMVDNEYINTIRLILNNSNKNG